MAGLYLHKYVNKYVSRIVSVDPTQYHDDNFGFLLIVHCIIFKIFTFVIMKSDFKLTKSTIRLNNNKA